MKQNTKRLYSMIIALLFLVVALVWYFDFLVPAYTDLQTAKGTQASEKNLLSNEQQVVSEFKTLLASYQSQSGEQQAIDTALPIGPHLADAIAQVYGIANANSISIQSVGIGSQLVTAPGAGSGVTDVATTGQLINPIGTITFTLGVSGSYENFSSFLSALETNMRILDVKQFSFQPAITGGARDLFAYNLSVETYYQAQSGPHTQ